MKKRNFAALTLACFALGLTACGAGAPAAVENVNESEAATPAPTNGAPETPITGGELVWALASAPPTLDLHRATDTTSRNVARTMAELLLYFGENNELMPLLAESYRNIDELTWEFNIRQGVVFHNGEAFNAHVVKLNLDRFLDPENAFPRADFLNMITEVEVIDDYTIHIHLEFPFAPLPAQITNYAAVMYAPAAIAEEEAGGRTVSENPIGTGPFKLDSQVHGDHIRVVRFDDHWRGPANLDSILFRVIPEPATRMAMVETGEAHGFEAMLSDVPRIETMAGLDLYSVVSTVLNYVGFNVDKPPMDDVRVRQAITMAVDFDDILYGIAEGQGVRAVGPIAPFLPHSPADNLNPLPYDPVRARELLIEAGFEDGFEIEIWYNDGNSVRQRISELIQANLADIGITVSITNMEWGAYLDATSAGEHDMFVLGWTGATGDPDIQVQPLFHTVNIGPGGNRMWYDNPRVDYLIDAGRQEADPARRTEIYEELVEILIYDAPMMFLFHPFQPFATNGIDGINFDFGGTPDFFRASFR